MFLSELTDLNSQLRDLDTQKVFDDDAVISKVISSLPPDFNAFTTAWELASPPDKTLPNLSIGLVKEEAKLKTAATASIDVTKAFYNHSKNHSFHRSSSNGSNSTSSGAHNCSGSTCTHSMHKSSSLSPALQIRSPSMPVEAPLTLEQRQARQKYFDELKKTTTCHNCGKSGHWQGECPALTEAERQELRRNRRSRPSPALPSSRSFPAIETPPEPPDHEILHTGFMAFDQSQFIDHTADTSLDIYLLQRQHMVC